MFRQIVLFLLFSSVLTADESEEFCQTNPIKYSAFNYGDFLIIGTHFNGNVIKYWVYMTANKKVINIKKYPRKFQEISNNIIKAVISFDFSDNCPTPEFCTAIEKARKLVLIQFKAKKPSVERRHPFAALVHKKDNFTRIKDKSNMPWNWPPSGGDVSKTNIFPNIDKDWGYYGGVFSPKHNTMIVITHNLQNDKQFRVKTRKLNQKGKWEEWKELFKTGFRHLFILNNTLFGITPFYNSIIEFKQDMTYTSKGPLKPFFNCKISTNPVITKPNTKSTDPVFTKPNTKSTDPVVTKPNTKSTDPVVIEPNTEQQIEALIESPIDTSNPINDIKDQMPTTSSPANLSTNSSSNTTLENEENSKSKSGSSLGLIILWILLAVIFVLMVGLILFFVVFRREPKPKYVLKKKDQN